MTNGDVPLGTTGAQPMARPAVAMILSGALLATLQISASRSAHAGTGTERRTSPFVCPVTLVNGGRGGVYSNDSLSVVLWSESRFVFAPEGAGFVDDDGALGVKVGWELRRKGSLFVTGRRLDGEAPPARAYIHRTYDDYVGGMSLYLVFPTPGCWEITGVLGDASLTFIVQIEKMGDGPEGRFSGPPREWRVSQ